MKKFAATVALIALVASPALAQSYDPDIGSGNIAPNASAPGPQGFGAYARAPYPAGFGRHVQLYQGGLGARAQVAPGGHAFRSSAAPGVVYDRQGHFYGADPDPNIRAQLRRESEQGEW